MEKENTKYQDIERYLAGDLDGEALAKFESRLTTDQDFAVEVQVNKDLDRFLKPDEEDQLEAQLKAVSEKYAPAPTNSPWKWGIRLGVALLLILIVRWLWKPASVTPASVEPAPIETTAPEESRQAKEEEAITPPVEEPKPAETPSSPTPSPKLEQKKQEEASSRPIAANFAPNPLLEAEMGNLSRSLSFTLEIQQPHRDQTFSLSNGKVDFSLEGKIEFEIGSDLALQALIFTNKQEDYESYQAVHTIPLQLGTEAKEFPINYQTTLPLGEGLYYLIIENVNSGEVHLIERFRVE